jgi:hypothetical protein
MCESGPRISLCNTRFGESSQRNFSLHLEKAGAAVRAAWGSDWTISAPEVFMHMNLPTPSPVQAVRGKRQYLSRKQIDMSEN